MNNLFNLRHSERAVSVLELLAYIVIAAALVLAAWFGLNSLLGKGDESRAEQNLYAAAKIAKVAAMSTPNHQFPSKAELVTALQGELGDIVVPVSSYDELTDSQQIGVLTAGGAMFKAGTRYKDETIKEVTSEMPGLTRVADITTPIDDGRPVLLAASRIFYHQNEHLSLNFAIEEFEWSNNPTNVSYQWQHKVSGQWETLHGGLHKCDTVICKIFSADRQRPTYPGEVRVMSKAINDIGETVAYSPEITLSDIFIEGEYITLNQNPDNTYYLTSQPFDLGSDVDKYSVSYTWERTIEGSGNPYSPFGDSLNNPTGTITSQSFSKEEQAYRYRLKAVITMGSLTNTTLSKNQIVVEAMGGALSCTKNILNRLTLRVGRFDWDDASQVQYEFQGSNDREEWTALGTVSNPTTDPVSFNSNKTKANLPAYYRVKVTATKESGSTTAYSSVGEIATVCP